LTKVNRLRAAAATAVTQAEKIDARIAELSQVAGRIGQVIKLISANFTQDRAANSECSPPGWGALLDGNVVAHINRPSLTLPHKGREPA
jgi:hypothetical protein